MRIHTIDLKDEIKKFGKELDELLTYDIDKETHILPSENIKSIRYSINTDLLKSSMRMLNIECETQIPKNTVINFLHGIKVKNSFEYINYGDFVVYENSKNEDSNTYSIVCYDKMLYSMIDYEELDIVYPISIRDYITEICNRIGLEFQNKDDVFVNYNKTIKKDLYKGLGYTYRDVLDELAQSTASNICINTDGKLEIRYVNETNDTIDEEYLQDTNVQFGQKYGPVNSIVLSRSADSDFIALKDDESIAENGICEIKIKDNQIMNWDDRGEYLQEMFDKLNGLSYFVNDFSSPGICYYDIYDKYNVNVGNSTYPCLLLNDELNISNDCGQSEYIYTELPETTITDYTKSDKTERSNTKLSLIVDHQSKEIQALVSQVDTYDTTINNNYQELLTKFNDYTPNSKTIEIEKSVTQLQTDTFTKTEVNTKLTDGSVTKVVTETGTFADDGLTIEKTGAKTKGNFNESGLSIIDNTGSSGEKLLFAGYDENTGETIVTSKNMTVEKYLTIGKNSRIEDYEDGTGIFVL